MSIELKIKAKHLALEPSIIRKEENKLKRQQEWLKNNDEKLESDLCWSKRMKLQAHRKGILRNEARSTHLARAFIQGMDYKTLENKIWDYDLRKYTIIPRVTELVKKYGNPQIRKEDIENWMCAS